MMTKLIFPLLALSIALLTAQCREANHSGSTNQDSRYQDMQGQILDTAQHRITIDSLETGVLKVSGRVLHPLVLDADDLAEMPGATKINASLVCQRGHTVGSISDADAVPLKDILAKATILQENHRDRNFYIVARAGDGYIATFSWAELFNNPLGAEVYVIFGAPDTADSHRSSLQLISKTDIHTGPRYVKDLQAIVVFAVE